MPVSKQTPSFLMISILSFSKLFYIFVAFNVSSDLHQHLSFGLTNMGSLESRHVGGIFLMVQKMSNTSSHGTGPMGLPDDVGWVCW